MKELERFSIVEIVFQADPRNHGLNWIVKLFDPNKECIVFRGRGISFESALDAALSDEAVHLAEQAKESYMPPSEAGG